MRQQGLFLRGQLAGAGRLLQHRILILRLPQIFALLADNVVHAGVLLQDFELGLQGHQLTLRIIRRLVPR